MKRINLETVAIHGENRQIKTEGGDPVIYPQVSSTIFRMSETGNEPTVYSRHDNPNRRQLESILTTLERGEACAAFASGMAASTAVIQSLLPGDHIIIPDDLYHGVRKLVSGIMGTWNIESDSVDMTRIEELKSKIRPNTKMIWIETPSNPLLHITDIEGIAQICKKGNMLLVVDNTWPSPVLQQPLLLGADLVIHSTSKYIGGHSDILGGAVIAKSDDDFFRKIRDHQQSIGAVPSPSDCWLTLRSIRTLPYRMRAHCENAEKVAGFLNEHSSVEVVYYPGLKSHPGHEIAKRQMHGYGGMISFLIKGDREATNRVFQSSSVIVPATSLGGVESIWEHRIRSEGPTSSTPDNLIRLSVGLEHPDDLIQDIDQALTSI